MKKEMEITVMALCGFSELDSLLVNQGFVKKQVYNMNDIYMISNDIDIKSLPLLDVIKKCVLVRDIEGIKKVLLYKYKKYDDNGDIIEQEKVECNINEPKEAIIFMETINYHELFQIYDINTIYVKDDIEIDVQQVNNKYVFIEMEYRGDFTTKEYSSIGEMKEAINSIDIPFDKSNYFVKKAEIMLKEIMGNN